MSMTSSGDAATRVMTRAPAADWNRTEARTGKAAQQHKAAGIREGSMIRRILPFVAVATALVAYSAVAYAAGPLQLRFAYPNPPTASQYSDFIVPLVKKINKDGAGTYNFKLFVGHSLVSTSDCLDRVEHGVADIAFCILGPVSRQFPQTLVATLPAVAHNAHEAGVALQRLYDQGIIAGEWKRVKPLAFGIYPDLTYHSVPEIKTLADFQGLKISVQGRIAGQTLEALGGTPISLPISDLYEALQRGTIKGVALGWPGVVAYKMTDIVKHHVLEPFGAAAVGIIMNNETYAKLPPKGKEAIDRNSGMFLTDWFTKFVDKTTEEAIDQVRHMKGQTVTPLSPTQMAQWMKRIEPVIASWEKRTPDGAHVLAAFRKEVADVRAGS
jgi:TRAP-type transport system periplasmic protein